MRKRKGLSVWNIGNKEYYKLYDTVIVIAEHLEDGSTRIRLNHNGFKTLLIMGNIYLP